MLDGLKATLKRLRGTINSKAERAYKERDDKGASDTDQAYAAGEAHAYGDASDEVRQAEIDNSANEDESGN